MFAASPSSLNHFNPPLIPILLPSDYQSIISGSVTPIPDFGSKKDLYVYLCHNPILIDEGRKSFSLEKRTGKKCYFLGARDLNIAWADTPRHWIWTSLPESRFPEVAKLKRVWWLEIRGTIRVGVLSPRTSYVAYIVYKLKNDHGFHFRPSEVSVGVCGVELDTQFAFLVPKGRQCHPYKSIYRMSSATEDELEQLDDDNEGAAFAGKMTTESQMMDATTSMGATNIATSSRTNAPPTMAPAEKPGKFSGIDFKRWQQKMFFYLTTLCLQRFTSEDAPEVPEGTSDKDRFVIVEAWKHSDFLCRNYILSGLQDDLYNVYSGTKTSKELWEALERKYKTEDAGIKKFLVARFLDFKMIDSKSVVSQVQELQVIIHDLLAEGLIVNDAFQVAAIVEKLPPLWKDFKNYLKHKRKEMTVEDLIVRLRIEEDNKAAERRSKGNSTMNGAHIVEDGQNNSKKRKNVEHGSNHPKKKFKGKCFNCGKVGHKSTDCQAPKKGKKKDQANLIESNKDCDDLCAMFTECNMEKTHTFELNRCHLYKEASYGYINLVSSTGFVQKFSDYKLLLLVLKILLSVIILTVSVFEESAYLRYRYSRIEGHFILGGRFHNLGYSEGNYFLKESP
ncbi:hypothetical protein CQW23_20539 [Capsicum baccatum]|uniref:CCHC-type domain-containing protein n=1 Tax=Capsicum baccatum TaxID=33114 RepID=A0A2G2W8X8_CAPBA|nr:hypothetical protein CQW23_20539 [Capsicum baccatum]